MESLTASSDGGSKVSKYEDWKKTNVYSQDSVPNQISFHFGKRNAFTENLVDIWKWILSTTLCSPSIFHLILIVPYWRSLCCHQLFFALRLCQLSRCWKVEELPRRPILYLEHRSRQFSDYAGFTVIILYGELAYGINLLYVCSSVAFDLFEFTASDDLSINICSFVLTNVVLHRRSS